MLEPKYIITCIREFTNKFEDHSTESFLIRICDTYEFAEELLIREFEEATREEKDRCGMTHYNPRWASDNERFPHNCLKVEERGSLGMHYNVTYFIHTDFEKNYLSEQNWL